QEWNDTAADYPRESSFIREFKKMAEARPEATACKGDGKSLSYRQLDKLSDKLANGLQAKGLTTGKKVALYLERNADLLPLLLAVQKTGATYIPLDPGYPDSRIQYIIDDAGAEAMICQQANHDRFELLQGTDLIVVEELIAGSHSGDFTIPATAPGAVYMIYTSGSTGNPKGVRIAPHSLLNFLTAMRVALGVGVEQKLLAVTSMAFDISGLEFYLPLLGGGTVVLAKEKEVKSPQVISDLISQHGINIMQATPSFWQTMKEADWTPVPGFKLLCGGEALPDTLAEWLTAQPAEVWNMYGPTETTIWSSCAPITANAPITIGRPIHNTTFYILDKHLKPVAPGLKGELYIGGEGLAVDYYQRPELTTERFIDWQYKGHSQRLYRTGDLAAYQADGTVKYLGRNDAQVKISGYRIELGEVESKIMTLDAVEQAAVVTQKDTSGNAYMVAFLKMNRELSVDDLRSELKQHLPAYMIPARFTVVEAYPLTPNGKVDKKALVTYQDGKQLAANEYVAPATAEETLLAELWATVLEIDRIGITDNFFNLGGASLQSVKISNLAEEKGWYVTPELIFEFSTIRELATQMKPLSGFNTGGARIQQEEITVPDGGIKARETAEEDTDATTVIIESMGMYLPEKTVESKDIVSNCRNEIRFPIRRLTGIENVRMVDDEFSLGLAERAIEKCMAVSKYKPEHIDVVISCNIFRMDGEKSIAIEPGLSVQLSDKFGFTNALNFDITNACTGVFTALYLAEAYIKSGRANRCLIVSGEYISHITKTSMLEVESYMDQRIAGLTLGDAGFAMILEKAAQPAKGFQKLDIFTMGAYSDLCIVKPTIQPHGGFVVNTNAIKMGEAGHVAAANHALQTMSAKNWDFEKVSHIIMHQASSITTQNAMKEINRVLDEKVTNADNVIDNIRERGNTATTTYWVATVDNILNGRIKDDSNLLYCISGSGLTLGTALYSFDDLPGRMQAVEASGQPFAKVENVPAVEKPAHSSRLRIRSVSLRERMDMDENGIDLLYKVTGDCLQAGSEPLKGSELDLVVYYGINREEYMYEPAISTFIAGHFRANASVDDVRQGGNTFAFDLMNGAAGFLNTCHVMQQMAQTGRSRKVLITTGEVDNNKRYLGEEDALPIYEGGAAMVLELDESGEKGFGEFEFATHTEFISDKKSRATWTQEKVCTVIEEDTAHHAEYADLTAATIGKLLQKEGTDLNDIKVVFVPQLSPAYLERLKQSPLFSDWAGQWGEVPEPVGNSTLTTPYQLHHAMENGLVRDGDTGLIINLGAGLQIGCATYRF
ncbi:MAG: amino acid adenylation domain-containing protein, partial [Cyclobacteriaceae bacterium]